MNDAFPLPQTDGFQSGSLAWDPFRRDVVTLLGQARHDVVRPIYYGSNHCFLVTLNHTRAGESLAVYKPARGEYPLYDFPAGTLYRREVGSWLVNCLLDWNLVPPTVVTKGQFGVGSLQLFIEAQSGGEVTLDELASLALLDVVLNNADRKVDHVLLGDGDRIWAIDHGLTFHVQPKLRTFLWHFAGTSVATTARQDMTRALGDLRACRRHEAKELKALLSAPEWNALERRLERLVQTGRYPDPRHKPVPYRW